MLGARVMSVVRCYHLGVRYLAAAAVAPDKQLLSKLRKTTGFSFVNCRKALEKFDNNIVEAEAWLRSEAQKEGWAKASKLQGRPMSQGLIGLTVHENCAAIVEVNCETDFVARNAKFHKFVSTITGAFLHHGTISSQNKIVADHKSLSALQIEGRTVLDVTALEVGNIGENIAVRRGVFLRARDSQLVASYVHATGSPQHHSSGGTRHQPCLTGKYGALVLFRPSSPAGFSPPSPDSGVVPVEELGRRLCQHVVGMNPWSVGEYEVWEERAAEVGMGKLVEDGVGKEGEKVEKGQEVSEGEEITKGVQEENETRLLHQEYMHDTSLTVGAMLQLCGATVEDFVRLECGEADEVRQLLPVKQRESADASVTARNVSSLNS